MTYPLFRSAPALLLMLVAGMVQANAEPDYLEAFFGDLQTLQADFDQQVVDSNRRVQQSSQGHMWIGRPGRFRWDYETPYRQQLIADGERLWSYDEDPQQVTVQAAADVLTSTPAMLLSGDRPLREVFDIREVAEGVVQLTPKADDSQITMLDLYFDAGLLARIEAQDSFGNTTTFTFTNVERNPGLDPAVFHFAPPAGADVVGDLE